MNEQSETQLPTESSQESDRLRVIQVEMKALEQRVVALEGTMNASRQTEHFVGAVSQRLSAAWNALLGKKEPNTDVAEVNIVKDSVSGIPVSVILIGLVTIILLVAIFD